jgi:hypothetical protein
MVEHSGFTSDGWGSPEFVGDVFPLVLGILKEGRGPSWDVLDARGVCKSWRGAFSHLVRRLDVLFAPEDHKLPHMQEMFNRFPGRPHDQNVDSRIAC